MSAQPKPDGGPAFPITEAMMDTHKDWWGISKRDYFAASALRGCATSAGYQGLPWDQVVKECYAAADAMLKARDDQ